MRVFDMSVESVSGVVYRFTDVAFQVGIKTSVHRVLKSNLTIYIQGVPKKVPIRVFRKGWVIFNKTVFNYSTTGPISTLF